MTVPTTRSAQVAGEVGGLHASTKSNYKVLGVVRALLHSLHIYESNIETWSSVRFDPDREGAEFLRILLS